MIIFNYFILLNEYYRQLQEKYTIVIYSEIQNNLKRAEKLSIYKLSIEKRI